MPINPKVKQDLSGVENIEVIRLVTSIYRYDSLLGMGLTDSIPFERATGDAIGKNFNIDSGSIQSINAVATICELFPDFDKECLEYLNSIPKNDRTRSVVFQRLAIYISERFVQNQVNNFDKFFLIIETLLTDGESSLKLLVGSDFLENIQNMIGNSDIDPTNIEKYLSPRTLRWWNEVNRFWRNLEHYNSVK